MYFERVIKTLIFVSGIIFLCIQVNGVLLDYFSRKTSFSYSKKQAESISLPAVVICAGTDYFRHRLSLCPKIGHILAQFISAF